MKEDKKKAYNKLKNLKKIENCNKQGDKKSIEKKPETTTQRELTEEERSNKMKLL